MKGPHYAALIKKASMRRKRVMRVSRFPQAAPLYLFFFFLLYLRSGALLFARIQEEMKRPHSLISSPSSSSSSNNYEVFLSFRGETRNNFTSHLCEALRQKGIHTFLDDDKLQRGKPISSELLRAIEGSQCSVVILSSDYASSRWCLDELVKILQCMNDAGQIVLPIFYHVDPSHVRKQTGSIRDAFQIHEQNSPGEKVQIWRSALREVGNLAGSHLNGDRNEADFIKDFVKEVSSRLIPRSKFSKDLVGMDSRLRKLSECVSESFFIGICGMGGMGKTTLARAYFEAMSDQYEASSFLANVRERCEGSKDGLVKLQNQLLNDILKEKHKVGDVVNGKCMIRSRLCWKRVLVILDDVDNLEQIEGLAGRKDWFGGGSRIILTTRNDGSLLKKVYKDEYVIHEVDQLGESEAEQLFSKKAFGSDYPETDYKHFSDKFIKYANGLPLALNLLGSFLEEKSLDEWESAWDRLIEEPNAEPNKEIMGAFLISYNGLGDSEKNIFLDIACFFNGYNICNVREIMDRSGFHGAIGIRALLDKSLLRRYHDDTLRMHDLLQEMGRNIATGKLGNESRRRSRIWDTDDFEHVINSDAAIEEVEAMVGCSDVTPEDLSRALSKMRKLRLLIIESRDSDGRWSSCPCPGLSNELRYLEWCGFPFNCFPPSFQQQGLVELQLSLRQIEPMKSFRRLKYIMLAGSLQIRKLEDFSSFPNLEKLILDGCENLEEIHPSIAVIRSLTKLSLPGCRRLKSLPTSMHGLKSLKILDIRDCVSLSNLPKDLGCLSKLEVLHASRLSLKSLSTRMHGLESLKVLDLKRCESLVNLPEDLGCLSKLEELNVSHIAIKSLSSSIGGLKALKKLEVKRCRLRDGGIPDDFGWLVSLEHLNLSRNRFTCLPACINQLSKLRYLDLSYCKDLRSLDPELPESLEMVSVNGCESLHTFLDPSKPCNLRCSATCRGCSKLVETQGSRRTAITSLGRHLQRHFSGPSRRFDIALPARDDEIPSWFTHRSRGSSSTSLPLHPNWCNNNWMGFALCACYSPKRRHYVPRGVWRIKINDRDWGFGRVKGPVENWGVSLWILYLPRDEYFRTEWQKFVGQIEFSLLIKRKSKVSLHPRDENFWRKFLKNIRMGARLVYKQDIEELNQTAPREPLETALQIVHGRVSRRTSFEEDDTDTDADNGDTMTTMLNPLGI